jgi:hypothetical protein
MAEPTTRSGLVTRITALETELAELRSGAHKMSLGLDSGSERQQAAAAAVSKSVGGLQKHLASSGLLAEKGKLTA